MNHGLCLYEGDYCFSLPVGSGSAATHLKKEEKMKSRSEMSITTRTKPASRSPRRVRETDSSPGASSCPREQMIAEAAYFRAERRGFAPGNEMTDWLEAEADVESALRGVS